MPPRKATTGRSQSPRQRFAEELHALRVESGESLRKLAERMGWDWSLFGKMERGETIGGPEVALALDQHYGMRGGLLALWELALGDSTQFKEQYRRYMKLEAEATGLSHFAVSVPPGLLQTDGYATAVLSTGGASGVELAQQVEARAGRRALLVGDGIPHFRTVLSETVLRTPLADPREWRAQLEHLLAMADHPRVTLQVLLQSAGGHGLVSTDVMFLRLPGGQSVAYTENAHRGELIEECTAVDRLQVAYDAVRDLALSPAQSRTFILRMLEEVPCDVPSST
ncbi:helix-turn-helix domain-containing protein [Streptomyces sp. NPDC094448]|uniref:helix-turn-helix domain-containing protein n=1 Tax=Streptomyces sp. NPDC094448 TaxID=3366063 RepID=UPI003813CC65